jgi:hypothetical protein
LDESIGPFLSPRDLACNGVRMSRLHRNTFHPPHPDADPVKAPSEPKPHGKHSGHSPPPWNADPHGHEARDAAARREARARKRRRSS